MAILKTFLCVFNTRSGSLISGCYTLVISLICLVYYLFRYVGHKLVEDSTEYKGIVFVGFVLYGFMIVSSLVVIPGVQLDKRYLLLPWIYIIILIVLYDTGSVALLTTVHMEREKTLHAWEIVWVFFYLFRLAANCYCFTCVVSQYQELSDGRGTYDYLYKPRRRRTRFQDGSYFDIDTVDLPFGVHLPPYTTEDDRENSPPMYDQIFPEVNQVEEADISVEERNYVDVHVNSSSQTPDYSRIETVPHRHVDRVCHIDGACGCHRDQVVLRDSNITIETLPENYRDIQFYNYLQRTNHESEGGSIRSLRGPQSYEITVNVEWI